MIRFHTGDPGGVPSSPSSASEKAPRLLERAVTGGSLPQFTEAWPHSREEDINSSHWWFGVITDSQFKQFKEAGTGVKTRGAGEGMPFEQGGEAAGEFIIRKGGLLSTSFSGETTSLSSI